MKLSTIQLNLNNREVPFHFRSDSLGDKGVIEQIFSREDYGITQYMQGQKLIEYHNEKSKEKPSLIIDAGANIGASAVYFANTYKNTIIFTIEPDITNWKILGINTDEYDTFNFHGAISDEDGQLSLLDPGHSDWGFRTGVIKENESSTQIVKSISPESILSHQVTKNTTPLIFKIDIEGGEETLFQGDVSWLNKFPAIMIETHDWMLPFSGSSRNFIKAVSQFDFDFLHRGENIFLFNRQILGN